MLTAILPVVGVLVGASLQYLFTRYLETQRYQRDLRTQAYLDYIKSVSGLARLNDPQGSQERDLLAKQLTPKRVYAFMVLGKSSRRLLRSKSLVLPSSHLRNVRVLSQ